MYLWVLKASDESLGNSNTERGVEISARISKEGTFLHICCQIQKFTSRVKILEYTSNKKIMISQKVKIYTNHSN